MGFACSCLGAGKTASPVVSLNVGGACFSTTSTTLARCPPKSKLARLIRGRPHSDGVYYLDRDSTRFHHVLNFLRDGQDFVLPTGHDTRAELAREAKFLGLEELVTLLSSTTDGYANGWAAPPHMSPPPSSGSASNALVPRPPPAEEEEYAGAPIPFNEVERVLRLDCCKIVNTSQEEDRFNNITKVVAGLINVPICLVSLVGSECQWFKSKVGLDADSTPRNTSFCAFMLKPEQPSLASMMVIEDALLDHRVSNNPLVKHAPFIRFYAGCPLQAAGGLRFGALCCIDVVPRNLHPWQAQLLVNFGQITVQEIERDALDEKPFEMFIDDSLCAPPTFACGERREERMREAMHEAALLVWASLESMDWPVLYANEPWQRRTGLRVTPSEKLPKLPTVSGNAVGVNYVPGRPLSLWEWLQTSPSAFRGIFREWLDGRCSSSRNLAIEAFVAATAWGRDEQARAMASPSTVLPVSCRLAFAEYPLDANAAAIRPVPMSDGPCVAPRKLPGLPPGRLIFVTVAGECEPSDREAVDLDSASASSAHVSDSIHMRLATAGGVGSTTNAMGLKPPRSPFEDVRLLQLVGSGSFGSVFFGLWSGSAVAVKVLETKTEKDSINPQVEACLSASLSHPNLVQTYKYSTRRKRAVSKEHRDELSTYSIPATQLGQQLAQAVYETWIVQEWCEDGTLWDLCENQGAEGTNLLEVLEISLDICSAGAYLHNRGIIHGDLTAKNVLLKTQVTRKGYICKVCDFGLARIWQGESGEVNTQSMGTVTHMPPEALTSLSGSMTPMVDTYAFGILLWQVVTGWIPYKGLTPPQIVLNVAKGRSLELPVETHEDLKLIYTSCVSVDATSRPTFEALISSLMGLHEKHADMGSLTSPAVRHRRCDSPLSARLKHFAQGVSAGNARRGLSKQMPGREDSDG